MKNRRKYLLWIVLLTGYIPLLAVGNKPHTNPSIQILQPSLEAQSLGDFAEIPVDLYTGRTNINIPLFTITHNDIEVPVSLSYHGGGIKVDDECGIVGLGWTLNASGVVSRIVRGMPDELYQQGIVAGYNRLNDFRCIGSNNRFHEFINKMKARISDGDPNAMVWQPTTQEKELLQWMEEYGKLYDEGHFDTSPDNFTFSVQGLYGAFVNGKASQKQSNTGCSITQSTNSFQITDANGLTYMFNDIEQQYYPYKVATDLWLQNWNDIEQQKYLYNSAWWLSSIQSSAGDLVTFDYQLVKQRHRTPNNYAYTQYEYRTSTGGFDYDCNFITPHNYFMDTVHHQHKLLKSINTPNSRLLFHYSSTTSAANAVYRVDSISLYAKKTNDETLVERYIFTYSGNDNRSKLKSIVRQGKTGQTQRYDFAYHLSCSVGEDEKDHWGYYAPNSKGTFPDMNYLNITPREIPRDRASSRHANETYATNNMLASITYPSGLEVKLAWEPHDCSQWSEVGMQATKEYDFNETDASKVGGVRIKNIEYYDQYQLLMKKEYTYVDSFGNSTGVLSYPPRYASLYRSTIQTSVIDPSGMGSSGLIGNEPYLLALRSNGLPYTLNGGGHIEYSHVTEVTVAKTASWDSYGPMNRTEYHYCTSAMAGCSDLDDTNYNSLIPTDMLQLTSQKHQRGHLLKKVEYSDECKTTLYDYEVIEQMDVATTTGALFPIADFQQFNSNSANNSGSINPYKNFGMVKYRVIPYNKRLVSQQTTGEMTNTYHAYSYATNSYSSALNADMPITHTFVTSEGDTLIEHFTYLPYTNKVTQCITTKQGHVVDAYKLEYDNAYRVIKKYTPLLSPTSLPSAENITWDLLETYNYATPINKIVEVINHKTNLTTTYLWSYGGQYPIAEITNATLATIKNKLGETQITQLQQSYTPDISVVNNLRTQLSATNINTMTYEPLVGIKSYTDAKGYTQYYEYDDFGKIQEIYEMVNGTKTVLKRFDYQIKNQ